jgi:hypothetical protein
VEVEGNSLLNHDPADNLRKENIKQNLKNENILITQDIEIKQVNFKWLYMQGVSERGAQF